MEVYLSGRGIFTKRSWRPTRNTSARARCARAKSCPPAAALPCSWASTPTRWSGAYSELEKRGLIRTLPKKGAFVRGEAAEKPPDTPDAEAGPPGGGTESGEAGGIHAEGPPQAERAGGGTVRDPAGGTAASPKQDPAARQETLAGNRQDPAAAMQGALAGAERQEALLCAKEALLRLRRAGVSAAEAHALIKQLFGEAEKGEKR